MIYKGTDLDAFDKASKGLTKQSRSKQYQKYKAQNQKKREKEARGLFFAQLAYRTEIPKQSMKVKLSVDKKKHCGKSIKYVEKKTILDDIRDYRSSKIISDVANSLAVFVVRCGGRQWDNDTKNLVRSSIALAISEITNKVLKKPLKVIDNIELFIQVGQIIYKIIVWIDKNTKLWTTDDKAISTVTKDDEEYVDYIRNYPRLAAVTITVGMKYKVGDVVLLNTGQTVCIIAVNIAEKTYRAVCVAADKKEYIITDADILRIQTSS